MKKLISQNLPEGTLKKFGLLNAGVTRIGITHRHVETKSTYLKPIVRSKVAKNGDIYEETEFVEPSSIPHPLENVIYDPATMSLTAQLSAGVPLQPVSIGKMFSDPLEGERIALGIYQVGLDAEAREQEQSPVEPQTPVESQTPVEPKSE